MLKGSIVAIVTPMHEDGSLDQQAFLDLVEWHIQSKTDAIVVTGTTGEAATLEPKEYFDLTALAVKLARGRLPIIAGTGTNCTRTSLKLAAGAKEAGADACLVITPYYNKPTQRGLYEHYKAIAEHIAHPVLLYNLPGRTACDMLPDTIEQLSRLPHIIGIKESTGKIDRTQEILARCPKEFTVLSGDDATALQLMLAGAKGVISVTANIAPTKMHELCAAALAGDHARAEKLNAELQLLHDKLFVETNPIPTKWALKTMGKIANGLRLPLVPLDERYYPEVLKAMQAAGVN